MDPNPYRDLFEHVSDGVYFVDRSRRITYWNVAAERLTGFAAVEVMGKSCADQILVHVDAKGRSLCGAGCPLSRCLADGRMHEASAFLRHKQGHRVPALIRALPLRDEHGAVVGAAEIFADLSVQEQSSKRVVELEHMAFLDPLTRLANRRFLEQHLEARLHEMRRFGWPFGVVLFDIDRFKDVNDTFGHTMGDEVLRMVARTAQGNARPFDLVARYGGDEFVQVVGNANERGLGEVADRLRVLVKHSALIVDAKTIQVTVSVGTALAQLDERSAPLLERADQAMYQSKRAGRDRTSMASIPQKAAAP
jgi:diguanylate cyclase (GGDEF)-like protein/PAS domain S-box-containing protein